MALNAISFLVCLLFLEVPWVGLQCVIVVFPDHTHLLFFMFFKVNVQNGDIF